MSDLSESACVENPQVVVKSYQGSQDAIRYGRVTIDGVNRWFQLDRLSGSLSLFRATQSLSLFNPDTDPFRVAAVKRALAGRG